MKVPVGESNRQVAASVAKLLMASMGMFIFGFALVPLYDVICDLTGLNGKTADQAFLVDEITVDEDRIVTIQFLANRNGAMPWEFRPVNRILKVNPGALTTTEFYARNNSRRTIVVQAVPSVTPFQAAQYLHKTECFCFEQQQLAGGESMAMPLRFIIDNQLPKDITTLTLSYTLFDITDQVSGKLVANLAAAE